MQICPGYRNYPTTEGVNALESITLCASPGVEHQQCAQAALAEGFRSIGVDVKLSTGGASTKHVAVWGWRKAKRLRRRGHNVLVIERGYLGDRHQYHSLAWNGLNGRATFPDYGQVSGDRFRRVAELKPWKYDGDYIVLLGQVPGDQSLRGKDLRPWYSRIAAECREIYGLPVVWRPHPLSVGRPGVWQPDADIARVDGPLDQVLDNAALAVTWNSNSGVDAVLAGVPTIVADEGSMLYHMTEHTPGIYPRFNRTQWAYQLSWRQWDLDEIAKGIPCRGLVDIIR